MVILQGIGLPSRVVQYHQISIPCKDYYLTYQNRIVELSEVQLLPENAFVVVHLKLKGGKGGYGQNMKSKGSKKFQTTNLTQSKDLQGRKIINVTNQRGLIQFFKKQRVQNEYVKKELQKYRQMQQTIKQQRIISKIGQQYNQKTTQCQNKLMQGINQGLKRSAKNYLQSSPIKKAKIENKKGQTKQLQSERKCQVFEQQKIQQPINMAKSLLSSIFKKQ